MKETHQLITGYVCGKKLFRRFIFAYLSLLLIANGGVLFAQAENKPAESQGQEKTATIKRKVLILDFVNAQNLPIICTWKVLFRSHF